jgi:Glycosyl hydrolase catalytic core
MGNAHRSDRIAGRMAWASVSSAWACSVACAALWACGSGAPGEQAGAAPGEDAAAGSTSDGATMPAADGSAGSTPDGSAGSGPDGSAGSIGDGGRGGDSGARDGAPADGAVTGVTGTRCKRGMATNTAPSSAFAPSASLPGVAWWYDWSNQASSGGSGNGAAIEFDPMLWGGASLNGAIPAGSRYLLGFNEPNFKAQANLTAAQAAADWPTVEAKANGIPIVSPAVNYCGSASNSSGCSDPSVTDPYTYLKDFFADCAGCKVDHVAVHWYNCDLPSLRAYLEGNVDAGGGLQGFVQFGKPIWLTEFACDSSHSVADQQAYMQAAVPYLEGNPHVFRYSWFSASPIPNALLMNPDGSPTDLGKTYAALPSTCL